ncbi:MAG: response regulator [Bacteroidota bacterium]
MMSDNEKTQNIPDILIVDDVSANLKILGEILKREGYKVRPVPDGILALQVAAKEKPDLILLDIMMPGMDGFEVCRRLKENTSLNDIPVIFISALNDTRDIVKALSSGGVDFITKPFKAEEVTARVNTHLKLHLQSKKLLEQSKELKHLNQTKDKFFSIIAHDLRGPLGGFMGLTELMADDSQLFTAAEQKEMTNDLSKAARNIFNLLENLLEWAQMQQGHTAFMPRQINLSELVFECIKMLSESIRKKSIRLSVEVPANQEVFADINMLQSVIRNLVSNAIKFTPQGGRVSILAGLAENNTSVIAVKDSGIGMSITLLASLFQININSSRPGTEGEPSSGLGLLLCKEFIEKHGGELWVESEEGKGSDFFFTIPCNAATMDTDSGLNHVSILAAANQIDNLKILIAEDNENSEKLIRIVTRSFSNDFLEAATGAEAVEVCRNNPDIDLILMDIKMPVMDGLEATRQIRQFNKNVIIIAQTAFGLPGDREKAIEAGCNDYIAKPIEIALLLELIQKNFSKGGKKVYPV